jgi:acetolactate synthase I/II/III large subunit
MATSGPGATNLVTAIADAYMDSVPLVAITGQVPQAMIGKGAFQETDFFGMTLPVVKHSYLITDINDIPRVVKEAFYIARTGRPGPVVIDFPKNLQQAKPSRSGRRKLPCAATIPDKKGRRPGAERNHRPDRKGERPGALLRRRHHHRQRREELRQFAEATQIPVTTTIMGCGAFPETHPLVPALAGHARRAYANWAVSGEFKPRKSPDEPMVKIKDRGRFAAGLRRAL